MSLSQCSRMYKSASNCLPLALMIASNCVSHASAKGGATKGASAGGVSGMSADDFTSGHYTEEEMNIALCFLAVIMCMFFAVCACQWYYKIVWECSHKWPSVEGKRSMPCAPYSRDGTGFNV